MRRSGGRFIWAALAALLVFAALPAVCSAFQTITIEANGLEPGEVLVIHGDQVKTSDEVTVAYDPLTGEFVITHDVLEPIPPECHAVGPGPPFKEVRCLAALFKRVYIYAGTGQDKVVSHLTKDTMASPPPFSVHLGGGSDLFTGGDEDDEVDDEEDGAGDQVDVGGGNNVVSLGDGNNVLAASDGNDTVKATDGNQKLALGNGDNEAFLGDGSSRITAGSGRDWVALGAGPSAVSLGEGDDYATTGGGPDVFHGGPGADLARLGAGNDTGFGGTGKDKLLGGPGGDHLYGGPAFDILGGGPGAPDRCFGGPGGAQPIGCEVGVQYGRMPSY